MYQSHIAIIS